MRLEEAVQQSSNRFGYLFAAASAILGLFLIWWLRRQPAPLYHPAPSDLPVHPRYQIPPKEAATSLIETPLVESHPVEAPPIEAPPIGEFPAEKPSVEEPPFEEPPFEEPPFEETLIEEPPIEEPLIEEPPIDEPPFDEIPIEDPSFEEPSIEEPSIEEPSIERPLFEEPKITLPPLKPDGPLPALEKISLKDTTLYDGAFEFSYSAEKTQITLPGRTKLRINQYRSLADLGKVLPDRDLLQVLRTAKSTWKIPEFKTGRDALARLISQKDITSADQFFVNQDYLGLMFRDEVNNGRWLAWIRGVWKIHPFTKLFADLISREAFPSRQAAHEILDHENLSLVATLEPDVPLIRAASKKTPRDRRLQDNRHTITLAADLIEAVALGKCSCASYSASPDFSPVDLVEKGKFIKTSSDEVGDSKLIKIHHVTCLRCHTEYSVASEISGQVSRYEWTAIE